MVGHAAKGKAAASRDATLLALVVIVILLFSQGIPDSNDGFGIAPRVAQILTPDDIGIGKHAEIVPFLRTPDYASLVETTVLYIIDK